MSGQMSALLYHLKKGELSLICYVPLNHLGSLLKTHMPSPHPKSTEQHPVEGPGRDHYAPETCALDQLISGDPVRWKGFKMLPEMKWNIVWRGTHRCRYVSGETQAAGMS